MIPSTLANTSSLPAGPSPSCDSVILTRAGKAAHSEACLLRSSVKGVGWNEKAKSRYGGRIMSVGCDRGLMPAEDKD